MKFIVVDAEPGDDTFTEGMVFDINLSHVKNGKVTLDLEKMKSKPPSNRFYWIYRFAPYYMEFFNAL